MITCEMCGEEIEQLLCPFCGTENVQESKRKSKRKSATVNIKEDLPTVEVALNRVKAAIAQYNSCRYLKVIHGYGSSGKGGVIKSELHRMLAGNLARQEIQAWIPGEEFSADYEDTRYVLDKYPSLENDEDYRNRNRGITIIVF